MKKYFPKSLRRLNLVLHRDIGYFLSGLIIIYCISGLALNHIDDWNPDFIIVKTAVSIPDSLLPGTITDEQISAISALVGEQSYTLYDFPTAAHVKVYYDNATLQVDRGTRTGHFEKITRRPVFFESNILHRNSVKGWKWAADIFSLLLIGINITGLFIIKGKGGFFGRGKWFVAAGMIPPLLAVIIFNIIQQ